MLAVIARPRGGVPRVASEFSRQGAVLSRHKNVVNVEALEWREFERGDRFAERRKQLSAAAGSEKLGCSFYEVPPGKTAWPRHYHLANEEAVVVLAGEGTLRLGEEEVAVQAGDYVALVPGEAHAHQLLNTGDTTLRYLCFSTMIEPDVTVYPDSNKVGIFAGSAPGGPREARTFARFLDAEARRAYWDGED